jgi:hypothetical protein
MADTTTLLLERLEIQDLMYRYGMAVDRRDEKLYRQVFTEDARIDYTDSGGIDADLDTVVSWLMDALAPFAGLQHNMTNHFVDIDGDTARACTYFVAHHSLPDGAGAEAVLTLGGFYQDRLVRTGAGWRIAERVELGVWMEGTYPETVAKPPWYGTSSHPQPQLPT